EDEADGFAEGDVGDVEGDGGVAIDAGIFEGFPVDDDVGAAPVLDEVNHFGEGDVVGVEFVDGFCEELVFGGGFDGGVGADGAGEVDADGGDGDGAGEGGGGDEEE